jgi:hypothetical protein
MKGIFFLAAIAVVTVTSPSARANLIFVGPEVVGGAGFGALPRALTVQSHTPSQNTESSCIALDGSGGLIAGSGACAPLDGDIGGDEAPPIGFPKQPGKGPGSSKDQGRAAVQLEGEIVDRDNIVIGILGLHSVKQNSYLIAGRNSQRTQSRAVRRGNGGQY